MRIRHRYLENLLIHGTNGQALEKAKTLLEQNVPSKVLLRTRKPRPPSQPSKKLGIMGANPKYILQSRISFVNDAFNAGQKAQGRR